MNIRPGDPGKRGAVCDDGGVFFSLWSKHAEKVELCLFSDDGKTETARLTLPARDENVFHGYVPGLKPGQVYGYRVHGPSGPAHRFKPDKVMLDPYAREILGGPDSLRARVAAKAPAQDRPRPRPWKDTVIYEMHPRGAAPAGTAFNAAAQDTYLKDLGVTAVEFLPVQAKLDEPRLTAQGLSNYWGYNTVGFFAPAAEYGTAAEFRAMAARLHAQGIEVILDVVYNHTAEGENEILSFRGIDNASYYKDADYTGCGNTLDFSCPEVRRMALDSLRFWAEEMGVDGFRFDLAPVLGREEGSFNPHAAFFRQIAADPVLSKTRLIAEPWDVRGYHLGQFPAAWHEWNDRFRDDVRRFWRGDAGQTGALATRLAGSHPEFSAKGLKTVNMIACHDGMTLHDLVTHGHKKNHANGEDNRDGHHDDISSNYGVEGQTDDPGLRLFREKQKRNMLATLFLAQGAPLLLAGDEYGNTQHGNNNAYCQDNPVGWPAPGPDGAALTAFVKKLAALRAQSPELRRDAHPHAGDILWLDPSGREKTFHDWTDSENRCLGMLLPGPDGGGLLAVFNAAVKPAAFPLPGDNWARVLDTAAPDAPETPAQDAARIGPRSVAVFRRRKSLP